jgi:hypothetical protein
MWLSMGLPTAGIGIIYRNVSACDADSTSRLSLAAWFVVWFSIQCLKISSFPLVYLYCSDDAKLLIIVACELEEHYIRYCYTTNSLTYIFIT